MKLTEIYKNKDRVLSFEIFPPKAQDELDNIDETLEICRKIREKYHTEAVAHLTCLCYDEKEIEDFCKELEANGIENILALRGDVNPNAPAKGVFRHASDLISYIKPHTNFCIAGACYPGNHPESADRIAGIDVPITPGIMPCLSAKSIKRMVTTCGAKLPDRFARIIDRYEDNKEALFDAGLYYAISQIIALIASGSDGVHIYTMNRPAAARRICEGIRNII